MTYNVFGGTLILTQPPFVVFSLRSWYGSRRDVRRSRDNITRSLDYVQCSD